MDENVQAVISGIDKNGFVWQLVANMKFDTSTFSTSQALGLINQHVEDTVLDALQAAMADSSKILDISTKYVFPSISYSFHKPQNLSGIRTTAAASGATAGVIKWLPYSGSVTGRQYIPGVCEGDYVNDFITDAYSALLDDVAVAFKSLTGIVGGNQCTFVILTKKTGNGTVVAGYSVGLKVGVLSKRIRT